MRVLRLRDATLADIVSVIPIRVFVEEPVYASNLTVYTTRVIRVRYVRFWEVIVPKVNFLDTFDTFAALSAKADRTYLCQPTIVSTVCGNISKIVGHPSLPVDDR
jgi:hypothetical protein